MTRPNGPERNLIGGVRPNQHPKFLRAAFRACQPQGRRTGLAASSDLSQRLPQIVHDVIDVLNPDREAQQVLGGSGIWRFD